MEETKKKLAEIFETVDQIEESSEGLLFGGFAIVGGADSDELKSWNSDSDCNCGCNKKNKRKSLNPNCNCNCGCNKKNSLDDTGIDRQIFNPF